jgi:hypothetical protein
MSKPLTSADLLYLSHHLNVLQMLSSPYMTKRTRVALILLWRRDRAGLRYRLEAEARPAPALDLKWSLTSLLPVKREG